MLTVPPAPTVYFEPAGAPGFPSTSTSTVPEATDTFIREPLKTGEALWIGFAFITTSA